MPEPHMLKLVLHWRGYGEEGTISWHLKGNTGSHSPGDLSDAAGNAIDKWESTTSPSSQETFRSLLFGAQSVDLVTLYEYDTSKDGAGHLAPSTALGARTPVGWVGTATGTMSPLQSSVVATTLTANAGQSFRGRQYFPGHQMVCAATNALLTDANTLRIATLAANMGSEAVAGIAESLSISTLNWAVYSPKLDVMTPIENVRVDNRPDIQRRRAAQLRPSHSETVSA